LSGTWLPPAMQDLQIDDGHHDLEPISRQDILERFKLVRSVTSPFSPRTAWSNFKSKSEVKRTVTSISDAAITREGSDKQVQASNRWKKIRTGVTIASAWRSGAKELKRTRILATCVAVFMCVVCGVISVAPNELLLSQTAGCLPTLFFIQYVYVLLTYIPQAPGMLMNRKIPLQYHMGCVVFSYLFPTFCSLSLDMGLPASIVMILKSLVLVFNMLVGAVLLGKKYSFMQVLAVAMVTVGVGMTSCSSFWQKNPDKTLDASTLSPAGLAAMCGALLCVALLGATQEYVNKKHGKHVDEQMFYMHFLGFPLFYSKMDSIIATCNTWMTSDRTMDVFGIEIPYFIALLVINTCMGDLLKRGTSKLIALTSSLTANLVVSFMRFCALLVSGFWLNAPPYPPLMLFFVGSLLILGGTVLYGAVSQSKPPTQLKDAPVKRKFDTTLPEKSASFAIGRKAGSKEA